MGKFFNKVRQVFNIFLILLLITAAAALAVYLLTTPEQRGVTFWLSIGFMVFALILETLQASGIAMRSDNAPNVPVSFSRLILGGLYFLFVVIMAVWNAYDPFTLTKYILVHVVGMVVFLVPMILINMAELRLRGADRKERAEGRINLASLSKRVEYVRDDLKASGASPESLAGLSKLSEDIRYSDSAQASGKLERALEASIRELENIASSHDVNAIARACTLAERALRERNDYIRNSK